MGRLARAALAVLLAFLPFNHAKVSPVAFEPVETSDIPGLHEQQRLETRLGWLASLDGATITEDRTTCGVGANHRTLGMFCADNPDIIYINASTGSFPSDLRTGRLDATIRHELAHRAIFRQCRTLTPFGANHEESVTSAFAVLFMGATTSTITDRRADGYQIGFEDWILAWLVGHGIC